MNINDLSPSDQDMYFTIKTIMESTTVKELEQAGGYFQNLADLFKKMAFLKGIRSGKQVINRDQQHQPNHRHP